MARAERGLLDADLGGGIIEEIEATMRIGPKPPALISYDRLLVPIKTTRGHALLSATLVDH